MRAAGRPGRGERARVAARVRALVSGDGVAGDDAAGDDAVSDGVVGDGVLSDNLGRSAWLPGADFERHVPGHGDTSLAGGWRERLRWDPQRKGATALGVAVVAAVAATGWWLAASRPHEVPISASAKPSSTSAAVRSSSQPSAEQSAARSGALSSGSAPLASSSSSSLVVDVAGKVRHPGIYTLTSGARIYDALRAAGGARSGVSTVSLNLAAPVHDGEQIVVGAAGAPLSSSGGGSGSGGSGGGGSGIDGSGRGGPGSGGSGASGASGPPAVVDINSATLEQLETLPGVGPVLGQHILDWRDAHGRFASVDQLREVSGIGDVRFAQLRPLVTA